MEKFNSRISGLSFILALVLIGTVVLYPTVIGRVSDETLNNMALTALGAAIVVVSKGADWFMRGRVTTPTGDEPAPTSGGGDTTVTIPQPPPSEPITVTTGDVNRPPPEGRD